MKRGESAAVLPIFKIVAKIPKLISRLKMGILTALQAANQI